MIYFQKTKVLLKHSHWIIWRKSLFSDIIYVQNKHSPVSRWEISSGLRDKEGQSQWWQKGGLPGSKPHSLLIGWRWYVRDCSLKYSLGRLRPPERFPFPDNSDRCKIAVTLNLNKFMALVILTWETPVLKLTRRYGSPRSLVVRTEIKYPYSSTIAKSGRGNVRENMSVGIFRSALGLLANTSAKVKFSGRNYVVIKLSSP